MSEREIEVYSYTLNIQSIKMKVKFPCKMKLEYAGEALTAEVSPNETAKFIFNQEVTLKQDTDRTHFDIIAQISTDKGAKYIAGVIKLDQSELVHQQGQMMIFPLTKCLDSEACCELRVDQVLGEKKRKTPLEKNNRRNDLIDQFSPGRILEAQKNYTGSRSEFQFPLNNNNNRIHSIRTKEEGHQSIIDYSRSPAKIFRKAPAAPMTQMEKNLPDFGNMNRDKIIEAEVYKESYQKLKEKYKKEAEVSKQEMNKRLALENNQNNFKLEIMRLKLRCEEQEKSISQKNSKIKEFQVQLASLQKKQLDLNYLREESLNKQHTLRMLEETIKTLTKDNEDLKNLNRERFESEQEKVRQLISEVDVNRQRYEMRIMELDKQLRSKSQTIIQKDAQLRIKEERISREQKIVDELEKQLQEKSYDHDRILHNQQADFKSKSDQLKAIIERLEREKAKLEEEIESGKTDQDKIKSYVLKLEYDRKMMQQEGQGYKSELAENKVLKERYQELVREHRILTEDKNQLQKQYDKSLQVKQSSLSDLNKQFKEQADQYKKMYRDLEEKLRTSQAKNLQLETSLQQRKNEVEKLKKANESTNREFNEVKGREKSVLKQLKAKQEEASSLMNELESYKMKAKNGDQMTRYEMQNLKQEISKTRKQLENQLTRNLQLNEKLTNQNNETAKLKIQIQKITQKGEKQQAMLKQKISDLESSNKQYQRKTEELNISVATLKMSEKQKQEKVQKSEAQCLKLTQKIEKQQRDIKMLEDKSQLYENQLKNKQNELNTAISAKEALENKLVEGQQKLSNLKNALNITNGEKNKNEKIIELLNREISDLKAESDRQNKLIQTKDKLEEDLRIQIKKSKEEYLKIEMKAAACKKEYDRFKEHLVETLNQSFSQIIITNTDQFGGFQILNKKEGLDSVAFNTEILNKISNLSKQIKSVMTKITESNKQLKEEVDRTAEANNNNAAKSDAIRNELACKLEEIQIELLRVDKEKEELTIKSRNTIHELQTQLEDRYNANKELVVQLEQLNFTINSLRMDQQSSNEHFYLKNAQQKSKIAQLQEKIVYLTNSLNQSEVQCQSLQQQITEITNMTDTQREQIHKKQKQLQNLTYEKNQQASTIDEIKRQKKQLLEKISELELKLSNEIDLKQKTMGSLAEEERKNGELKEFVATLIKQKESAIKADLEKGEKIIGLEGDLLESNREREMQFEENQRLKRTVEQQKETLKKLHANIKEMQAMGTDEKSRQGKLNEKIREKQRELRQNEESLAKLKQEIEKTNAKNFKVISELKQEFQTKRKQKDNEISALTERVNELEKELAGKGSQIESLQAEILLLEENLFMEKQSAQVKEQQLNKINEEITKLNTETKKNLDIINSQAEQLKEKQENLFQLSGKLYQLEGAFEMKENQYKEKISIVEDDFNAKYDSMVDEFQQRMDLIEKQKTYFKNRLEEKEEEYRKLVAEVRNNQLEDSGLKRALEEKIKRLEDERLNLISSKNGEIQRLAEDNKVKFDQLKSKQADLRRFQHEVQVARSTISKLEQSKRQTEEKIKQINKAFQSQLEQLKRKQQSNRITAESLQRVQWQMQRDLKKAIQQFSKRIISSQSIEQSQKAMSQIMGLEDEVIAVLHSKLVFPK